MASDLQKVAEQVWGMLDTLAAKDPQEYKRFVNQQVQEGREHLSPPEPSYSLECTNATYKGKACTLYINICRWKSVPYPHTDNDPIPVKGGTLRYLVHSNGKKTDDLLYDIAFNPRVIEECNEDIMDKMLTNLSLEFVHDMTSVSIRHDAVTKSEVKGKIEQIHSSLDEHLNQFLPKECEIEDSLLEKLSRKMSASHEDTDHLPPLKLSQEDGKQQRILIEELPHNTQSLQSGLLLKEPQHTLTESIDGISVKIVLAGVTSISDVDLEVSESDLQLSVNKLYNLSIQFKNRIAEDTLVAQFNKTSGVLNITAQCQL